jgi:hypothetical protein
MAALTATLPVALILSQVMHEKPLSTEILEIARGNAERPEHEPRRR